MIPLWASFRLYIIAGAVVALLGGLFLLGVHERAVGASRVQSRWDIAKAAQASLLVRASESARSTEHQQATDFAGIESNYLQATTHGPNPFDLPAAIAAGTLKLRDDCHAPDSRGMPEATAGTHAADAATTQALADSVANSIAAVRTGDAADARERQLRAQVIGLQSVLRAERTEP